MSCSVKCVAEVISQRKLYYHKPHIHGEFSFYAAFVYDLVSGKLVSLSALHCSSPHKGVVVVRHAVHQGALLSKSHLSSAQKQNGIHKTILKIYSFTCFISVLWED